jgi:predicted O-methyltransferase YrrM
MGLGIRNKLKATKSEIAIRASNIFPKRNKHLHSIFINPSDMCEPDRIMLYALVRGLRPHRVLEIGARWGGGARIISSALEDSGAGYAVGIDPEIEAFRPTKRELFGRYELIRGYSPGDIPLAVKALGGHFNLVIIDAMHTHDHVLADFNGVIPYLAPYAHVLLHDAFHVGINAAVNEVLLQNKNFIDCGVLTHHPQITDAPVAYQGLRLIRTNSPSPEYFIKDRFLEQRRRAEISEEFYNWDHHWNQIKPNS